MRNKVSISFDKSCQKAYLGIFEIKLMHFYLISQLKRTCIVPQKIQWTFVFHEANFNQKNDNQKLQCYVHKGINLYPLFRQQIRVVQW